MKNWLSPFYFYHYFYFGFFATRASWVRSRHVPIESVHLAESKPVVDQLVIGLVYWLTS
jgi:hypothetical protein